MLLKSWNLPTLALTLCVLASKGLGATISTSLPSSESKTCKCLSPTNACVEPNALRHLKPINETFQCSPGFVLCCHEMVTNDANHTDNPFQPGKKIKRETSSDFFGSEDFDYYADDDVIENADKIFEGFITFVNSSSSSSKDEVTEEVFPVYDDYYTEYDAIPDDAEQDFAKPVTTGSSSFVPDEVAYEIKQSSNNEDDGYVSKTTETNLEDAASLGNISSVSDDLTNGQIERYNDYYADDDVIENADKIMEGYITFNNGSSPPEDMVEKEQQPLHNADAEDYDISHSSVKISEESVAFESSSSVPSKVTSKQLIDYNDYYADNDVIENADKIFEGSIMFINRTSAHEDIVEEEQNSLYNNRTEDGTRNKSNETFGLPKTFKNNSLVPENETNEEQLIQNNNYKSDVVTKYEDKNLWENDTTAEALMNSILIPEDFADKTPLPKDNFYYADDDVIENVDKIIEGYIIIKNSSSTPEKMANEEQPQEYTDYYINYDYVMKDFDKVPESSNKTSNDLAVSTISVTKNKNTFAVEGSTTYKQKISRAIPHSITNDLGESSFDLKPLASTIYNSSQLTFNYKKDSVSVESSTKVPVALFPYSETTNYNHLKFDKTSKILMASNKGSDYSLSTNEGINQMENRSNLNNSTEVAMSSLSPMVANHSHLKVGSMVEMNTPDSRFGNSFFNFSKINTEISLAENCSYDVIGNCLNETSRLSNNDKYIIATEEIQMDANTTVSKPINSNSNDSFMQRFFNAFFSSSSFETAASTLENESYSPVNKSLIHESNATVSQSSSSGDNSKATNTTDIDSVTLLTDANSPPTDANSPPSYANAPPSYVNPLLPYTTIQDADVASTVHFNAVNTKPSISSSDIINSLMADRRSQSSEDGSLSTKSGLLDRSAENVPRTLSPIHIRSPFNFTFPANVVELSTASTPKPRKITSFLDWIFGNF